MKVIGENEVKIQLKSSTGPMGPAGADGKDGTSVTHSWNGTTLTVTSASGTSSADLKGEKGEPGKDGKDGATGLVGPAGADGKDGAPGADGEDGGYYSPSVDAEGNLTGRPSKTGMPGVAGANIRGPEGPKGEAGQDGATGPEGQQGATGHSGADGEDGGYYTPAVDNDGNLTWTASKADMPDVPGVNIKGPAGSIDNLPIASAGTLGGVMPAAKTDEMTQAVGVDAQGGLWAIAGGGVSMETLEVTTTEEVNMITLEFSTAIKRGYVLAYLNMPEGGKYPGNHKVIYRTSGGIDYIIIGVFTDRIHTFIVAKVVGGWLDIRAGAYNVANFSSSSLNTFNVNPWLDRGSPIPDIKSVTFGFGTSSTMFQVGTTLRVLVVKEE